MLRWQSKYNVRSLSGFVVGPIGGSVESPSGLGPAGPTVWLRMAEVSVGPSSGANA